MIFEFYSKTELDEWDVRKVFAELQWGVIWKVVKEEVYSGWKIQVYYAILLYLFHLKDILSHINLLFLLRLYY
jgi:hypothetical protein